MSKLDVSLEEVVPMVAQTSVSPDQPVAQPVNQPLTPSPVAIAEIVYPESDGQPMANNTEQFNIIVLIKENLEIFFAQDPNVFIAGDLFWYPIEGKNTVVYAPDVFVAIGRPKGRRSSYKQWEEGNQPPQVVFEILSPTNTAQEMSRKLLFYDRHGVEEYYVYDPDEHRWQVWVRGDLGLDWVELGAEWVSPRLGIRLDLSQPELVIYRPDGQRFLSPIELDAQSAQEKQRAEQEKQRAEQEKQRAEQEKQRAERLAARLRELGEDPELL
jgi:Uma2 family endonuclease